MTSADNNPTGMPRWTPERKAVVKRMWENGATASQIAAELRDGATRSAILGLVKRMKLKAHGIMNGLDGVQYHYPKVKRTRSMPISVTKDKSQSGHSKANAIGGGILRRTEIRMDTPQFNSASPALKGMAWDHLPGAHPVPLLHHTECKWIGLDGLWCNEPKQAGSSWCPAHHARAFQKLVTG